MNSSIFDNDELLNNSIPIDADAGNQFKVSAKWAKFISISGFAFIGLYIFIFLINARTMFFAFETLAIGWSKFLIIPGALLFVTFIFAQLINLIRFSNNIKLGIELDDEEIFNKGINALKLYFIFSFVSGVLTLFYYVFTFSINNDYITR